MDTPLFPALAAPSRADLDNACTKAEKFETQARHVLNSVRGHQDLERFKSDLRLALDLFNKAREAYLPVYNAHRDDPAVIRRASRLAKAVLLGTDALARWEAVGSPSDPFSRLLGAWKTNGYAVPAREGSDRSVVCDCGSCTPEVTHLSNCSVHAAPASEPGPCDCGEGPGEVDETPAPWSPDRSARWEVPAYLSDPHVCPEVSFELWVAFFCLGGVADQTELPKLPHPVTIARWVENNIEAGYLTAATYDGAQRIGPWWSDRTGSVIYTITERVKTLPPTHKGVPLPLWWYDFEDLLEHGQGRVSTYDIARAGFDVDLILVLAGYTGLFGVETVRYDTFTRTYVHAHGY